MNEYLKLFYVALVSAILTVSWIHLGVETAAPKSLQKYEPYCLGGLEYWKSEDSPYLSFKIDKNEDQAKCLEEE